MKTYLLVSLLWIGSFLPFALSAAHFENLVDLTIKVEDANYNLKVKSLRFNGLEIQLDPPDLFKPRKLLQYRLPPGRYALNWASEKTGGRWQEEGTKTHERILVLESGDQIVRISIKGDAISLY